MIEARFKDSSSVAARYKEPLGALDMARRGGGGERVTITIANRPSKNCPAGRATKAVA
jgi:hypothetical protein